MTDFDQADLFDRYYKAGLQGGFVIGFLSCTGVLIAALFLLKIMQAAATLWGC